PEGRRGRSPFEVRLASQLDKGVMGDVPHGLRAVVRRSPPTRRSGTRTSPSPFPSSFTAAVPAVPTTAGDGEGAGRSLPLAALPLVGGSDGRTVRTVPRPTPSNFRGPYQPAPRGVRFGTFEQESLAEKRKR